MKVQYVVIYERDEEDYWGYVPDLPGCFSAGDDLEDMNRMMREGIAAHIEVLMGYGDPVPPARSSVADAMVEHARLLSEPLGEELEARMTAEGIDPPADAAETIFSVLEVDVEHELAELEKYWTLLAGVPCPHCGAEYEGEFRVYFMGETGSNTHSYRMNQPVAELHGLSGRQREMRFTGACPNDECREWDEWRFEVEDGKVVRVWPLDTAGADRGFDGPDGLRPGPQ